MAEQAFTDANFKSDVLDNKMPVVVDFWRHGADPAGSFPQPLKNSQKIMMGK